MLNHNYIGTEHLLLGLIHEGEGVAAKALESLGISLENVRREVEEVIGQGTHAAVGHIPFTPRAKKVMELSLRESMRLGHNYIGTEHLLLGMLREGEGVAAQVLQKLGADLDKTRDQVHQLLAEPGVIEAELSFELGGEVATAEESRTDPSSWPVCPRCRGALEETARYRILDVPAVDLPGEVQGKPRAVPFAFCGRCGTWLGTLS